MGMRVLLYTDSEREGTVLLVTDKMVAVKGHNPNQNVYTLSKANKMFIVNSVGIIFFIDVHHIRRGATGQQFMGPKLCLFVILLNQYLQYFILRGCNEIIVF